MAIKTRRFLAALLGFFLVFGLAACSAQPLTGEDRNRNEADALAFAEAFLSGDMAAAASHDFTVMMKAFSSKEALGAIRDTLAASYGGYIEIYQHEIVDHGGPAMSVDIGAAFEGQCITLRVSYNGRRISGLHYSPNTDPVPGAEESPYPTRMLTFGEAGWELPGVLTLPADGSTDGPVVIIVHGSGPVNRDGRVSAQTPYRDMAEALAARGIATFRYDKRTLVHGSRMGGDITVEEETVIDAALAVELLRGLPDADFSRVIVAGHSLGAMVLPLIAQRAPADGYIALAPAATPLHRLIVTQSEYIYNLDGRLSLQERFSLWQLRRGAARVEKLREDPAYNPPAKDLLGVPAAYWRFLQDYDPPAAMAQMDGPLLLLQGEGDYQVTMAEFDAFKAALAGRPDTTLIAYPGLSHLFTPAGDPPSPDDYNQPNTVDEKVIADIAAWIGDLG